MYDIIMCYEYICLRFDLKKNTVSSKRQFFVSWWSGKGIEKFMLRIDNCDERRVYKLEDISGPKGGTYMFNTSPKSSDFCLSNDV